MSWVNLDDVYVNKSGDSIAGNLSVGGALTINDGKGTNTTYNVANEITTLRDSVSQDYIVAQGTSGIWFYRKWNSGLAEFWGGKELSGTGSVTAPAINFPFRLTNLLYKSASAIYTSGQKGVFIMSGTGASISLIDTGVYVIKQDITDNNTTTVAFIQYNVKGTWK